MTLCHSDDKKTDIAERLISSGLLAVEKKREKRLSQLVSCCFVVVLSNYNNLLSSCKKICLGIGFIALSLFEL